MWSGWLKKKMFYPFIYFWETEHEWGKVRERRRHRIWAGSRLQASVQHRAPCGAWTHEPWDHNLSWSQTLNWLSHLGAPVNSLINQACFHTRGKHLLWWFIKTERASSGLPLAKEVEEPQPPLLGDCLWSTSCDRLWHSMVALVTSQALWKS